MAAGPSRCVNVAPRWGDNVERANLGVYDARTEDCGPPSYALVIDDDSYEQVQQVLDTDFAHAIQEGVAVTVCAWTLR